MDTLKELQAVRPVIGRRIHIVEGTEKEWLLPVEQLVVGDIVRVKAGERMPADGVVIKGVSLVSKRAVNRIMPSFVKKEAGAKVQAGTINATATLEIKVTSDWQHSGFEQRLEQARAEYDRMSCWDKLWSHLTEEYQPSYSMK
ncbi:MAG: hypothetical protein SO119_00650 [Phascolarctobacterium sp.]|nr:hypothetical protein [Phascolarctobacterium sp.]